MYYWCIRDENGHPGQIGEIDDLSRIPKNAEEMTEEKSRWKFYVCKNRKTYSRT